MKTSPETITRRSERKDQDFSPFVRLERNLWKLHHNKSPIIPQQTDVKARKGIRAHLFFITFPILQTPVTESGSQINTNEIHLYSMSRKNFGWFKPSVIGFLKSWTYLSILNGFFFIIYSVFCHFKSVWLSSAENIIFVPQMRSHTKWEVKLQKRCEIAIFFHVK